MNEMRECSKRLQELHTFSELMALGYRPLMIKSVINKLQNPTPYNHVMDDLAFYNKVNTPRHRFRAQRKITKLINN